MQTAERYVNERLDYLGIVAGVCEEIGLAAYIDRLAGETNHHVSLGTATVAMILNGLGFSNRRLYLVPQFFANKPVEYLLGAGLEAADLNDDCLDRTLDWLYAHDPTQLFAGIATQARKIFGVSARHLRSVGALHEQLHTPDSDPSFFVADSGVYSEANMRRFNEAQIRWISGVPETSTEAKAVMATAANR